MKFGLLGADVAALSLAREAATSTRHELVWVAELGTAEDYVRSLAPEAETRDSWEDLLANRGVEALIVARNVDEELRAEQLRKLVQEGLPLLVSHPIHQSMLIYYELDMIRRESGSILLPYLPARGHPAVQRVMDMLGSDERSCGERDPGKNLGKLEQMIVERMLAERPREAVLSRFAADIDLMRYCCGELNRVSAMAPLGEGRYAQLSVQLHGPGNVLARWTAGPLETAAGTRITWQASRGKATLWIPQDEGPWQLTASGSMTAQETFSNWNPAAAALAAMEQAVDGGQPRPDWVDASRAVEITEAIDRSLNKGRTVELHYEDYTQKGTFKGTMTSLGCGLLVAALVMLPVFAVAAKLGFAWARYWAWFLLVVFVLFLMLQGLRLLFADDDERDVGPGPEVPVPK